VKDSDVIIIGAGIGGLICAGLLVSKGVRVLVLEKNQVSGGYLSSFDRGNFRFDSAVDCFSGLDGKGVIRYVLRALEVEDEIKFVRVNPIRESIFPGLKVIVDGNLKVYVENLKRLFPYEKKGIDGFFCRMSQIYKNITGWSEKLLYEKDESIIPTTLLKYSNHTYEDLLDEYIKNEKKLKAVISDRCPFLGLSPSKVSAVNMCALMMSYFESGAYRAIGGCQKLADTLVKGIKKKGGLVLFKKEVESIKLEKNKVSGVSVLDGTEYTGDFIVSNIDFIGTFTKLLKGDFSNGIKEKLRNPEISSSFFILYIGTDKDLTFLQNSSSIGYFPSFNMESFFGSSHSFKESSSFGITIPTISDRTMAPPGCHSISVHEMADYSYTDSWKEKKHELTSKVLKKAEKVLPGLQKNIMHLEAASPVTLERFTSNFKGAAYGWQQLPGKKNLNSKISNLYIAGHWGEMGGGILASAYSGFKAAKDILKRLSFQN
jgi:phytoene dehydrogenase-like protein